MDFKLFKSRINQLIRKSGEDLKAKFSIDKDAGKFIADISDGTRIIGTSSTHSITVIWGSRHVAVARI